MLFNKWFKHQLDFEAELEIRSPVKIASFLGSNKIKCFNRIEYLELLNLVLKYVGYNTRFLCPIETKSLEELDFIRVSRKLGVNHKNYNKDFDIFDDGLK